MTEILFVIKDDPEVDSTVRTHAQRGSYNKYARIARDPPVRRSTTWSEALLPWHLRVRWTGRLLTKAYWPVSSPRCQMPVLW
jgi:hypothetical protein